ncbi:hypothetical protein ACWNS2_13945 [Planococcus plakortidis]
MYIYRIGAVIETDEGSFVITEKQNGKPSKLEDLNKYVASITLLRHQGEARTIEEILNMKVEEYTKNNRLTNYK